jgi:hypothetical protein
MKQDLLDGYVRLLDDALTKLHGHFTSSAFRSALDGAGTSTTSASTSTPVSSGSPSVRPVTKDRTAAELTELYYTYQGTTPSPQQLLAGAGAVEALLGQGHTADAIRSAIVQVHREIPGAATASLESILPSYLASTASAGQTYTPRGGYELEVRDRGSDKARRMKKAGHKLFTGGALMYFIPMGIGVIASAALTADSRDPRVVTAPLVVLTPIVGPALMAVQLNLAWGELPPTIVLGAVFTTIETIGFIMLWDGVRRMVESGQYASRAHPERPRRHAVRDLFVAPTFRPGGGGLAIAGRF